MISRFYILASLFMLFSSIPAYGENLFPLPDDSLNFAASEIACKNYEGAVETALKAPPGGIRDFQLGMALIRTKEWEKAAEYLGNAAASFPLLADYALYNRALALYRLARYPASAATLDGFAKIYPESPLSRSAQKLLADALFESGNLTEAAANYQAFTGKYTSGTDALEALHNLALCRERMGNTEGAVVLLRDIWLSYPASPIAINAGEDLQRLMDNGARVAPYSADELFRRGTVLSSLRKYDTAVKTFNSIPLENQPDEFIWRLLLKTGKAYFKASHFREAEETLTGLLAKKPGQGIAEEAWYWLARSLDKNGRQEEAVTIYVKLAENAPCLTLGDDALLAAAFIRKNQNKIDDELMFLKKLVQSYPQSNLCQTAFWEIAWTSYQEGDMKTASDYFKKLLENDETRERALYWYGRTLRALKDDKGAANAFASLLGEFPHGFYAFLYKKETMIKEDDSFHISAQICNMLPVPAGFDRTKALISLGLNEEAAIELAASKRKLGDKTTTRAGLARLYLQMGDYHGAYSLFRDVRLHNPDRNTLVEWGIAYPLAYREEVEDVAAKYEVPESLIFAIIRAESSYYPKALSPCGAVGLMQLMPATAAAIGKGNFSKDQLTIPRSNISFGVRHLHDLLTLYDGDIVLTMAAYNAGSGNVYRWRKLFGKMSREQFIENIPFTETREYVKKVLAAAEIYGSLYKLAPLADRVWSKTCTVPRDAGPSPLPSAEPIKTSVRAASKRQ